MIGRRRIILMAASALGVIAAACGVQYATSSKPGSHIKWVGPPNGPNGTYVYDRSLMKYKTVQSGRSVVETGSKSAVKQASQ